MTAIKTRIALPLLRQWGAKTEILEPRDEHVVEYLDAPPDDQSAAALDFLRLHESEIAPRLAEAIFRHYRQCFVDPVSEEDWRAMKPEHQTDADWSITRTLANLYRSLVSEDDPPLESPDDVRDHCVLAGLYAPPPPDDGRRRLVLVFAADWDGGEHELCVRMLDGTIEDIGGDEVVTQ